MNTTIYFVCHAESDLTVRENLTRPLTAKGLEDSKRVISALKDRTISRIYSSPYERAVDTVKNIAEHLQLDISLNIVDKTPYIIRMQFEQNVLKSIHEFDPEFARLTVDDRNEAKMNAAPH